MHYFSHKFPPLTRIFQKSCSQIHRIHKSVTGAALARHMACAQWAESAFFPPQNNKMVMKNLFWILPLALATSLCAAPKTNPSGADTNAPSAEKNEAAIIPDATHKPVFTTNTVAIAGQQVAYIAETGMLPILAPTGSVRASVFYVAYTRADETNRAARPVTSASTAVPARRPCGCTSAHSARAA
jgi:hypothetical protein